MSSTESATDMLMLSGSTQDYIKSLNPRSNDELNSISGAASGVKTTIADTRGRMASVLRLARLGEWPADTARHELANLLQSDMRTGSASQRSLEAKRVYAYMEAESALQSLLKAEGLSDATMAQPSEAQSTEGPTQLITLDGKSDTKKE